MLLKAHVKERTSVFLCLFSKNLLSPYFRKFQKTRLLRLSSCAFPKVCSQFVADVRSTLLGKAAPRKNRNNSRHHFSENGMEGDAKGVKATADFLSFLPWTDFAVMSRKSARYFARNIVNYLYTSLTCRCLSMCGR